MEVYGVQQVPVLAGADVEALNEFWLAQVSAEEREPLNTAAAGDSGEANCMTGGRGSGRWFNLPLR